MGAGSVRITFDLAPIAAKLSAAQSAMGSLEVLRDAMQAALYPVANAARSEAPQPGKPDYSERRGARRSRPKLRDTMRVAARVYARQKRVVGVAGPSYPRGAHGHLVEHGHRLVRGGSTARVGRWASKAIPAAKLAERTGAGAVAGHVSPRPFLAPAAAKTQAYAQRQFVEAASEWLDSAVRPLNG